MQASIYFDYVRVILLITTLVLVLKSPDIKYSNRRTSCRATSPAFILTPPSLFSSDYVFCFSFLLHCVLGLLSSSRLFTFSRAYLFPANPLPILLIKLPNSLIGQRPSLFLTFISFICEQDPLR